MVKTSYRRFVITFLLLALIITFAAAGPAGGQADRAGKEILLLDLEGVITAGKAAYISRLLLEQDPEQLEAVVILMDTPGGLVDATLDLARSFGAAPVPVVVLVAPSGAIAASAGAFILVSADVAVMAPGTTVGAASPVALSPGGAEQADDKTTAFLAGHMRSLARERGRPQDVAERFVTENLTLDAVEALEKEVIDFNAANLEAMLEVIDGFQVEKEGVTFTLSTRNAVLVEGEMNLREKVQDKVSDPQIAFLLLMAGAMGLYVGFGMPGTFVPEVLGGIALVLGIYGLGLFDTNTAGIVLLLLGFALLAAEVFTSGFGILGVGGGISLLIGAVLLPSEPLMAPDWYPAFLSIAVSVTIGLTLLSFAIIYVFFRSRRQWKGKGGVFFKPAQQAETMEALAPKGTVKMRGEIWNAVSEDGSTIEAGSIVEVSGQDGLTLLVKKKPGGEKDKPPAAEPPSS